METILARLVNQVDEIVVTDDASTDNTPEIAESYGAHVYRLKNNLFTTNEGQLRQIAWNNFSKHADIGTWSLCIDADEMFYPSRNIDQWLAQDRYTVLGVVFYHMWNETHYRVDKAWKPTLSSRLFRYRGPGIFKQSALASGSEPSYVAEEIRKGNMYPHTGFKMKHLGYLRDEDKQAKYERYMELDKGEFHSLNHLRSILDPNPTLALWEDI